MFRLSSFIFQLIVNILFYTVIICAVDIPLSNDWSVTNWNQSKNRKKEEKQTIFFNRLFHLEFDNTQFVGIKVQHERIPSGVFSALQNANITDSVVKSYNDVNLRWIAKDKWKYSLEFDRKFHSNFSLENLNLNLNLNQISVADELLNHSQVLLVFHGLDTIADISLNNHELTPSPQNMFVRYRYDVRDKLITVFIFSVIYFIIYVNMGYFL